MKYLKILLFLYLFWLIYGIAQASDINLETDENTSIIIHLKTSDEVLYIRIKTLPDKGTLYQHNSGQKGQAISPDTEVTDPNGWIVYEPVNQKNDYSTSFVYNEIFELNTEGIKNSVSIKVKTSNDAPQFSSVPLTNITAGMGYVYEIKTYDKDSEDSFSLLDIKAISIPTWLVFKSNGNGTAILTGIAPDVTEPTDVTIILRVTDQWGKYSDQTFIINVSPKNIRVIDASIPMEDVNIIYQSTTWNYDLVIVKGGNIEVRSQVLSIPAGTCVEFDEGFGLIINGGGLQVNGTAQQPTTFKGSKWSGIDFKYSLPNSTISHCTIRGAEKFKGGGLCVRNISSLLIDNCIFTGNSAAYGGGIYIDSSKVIIKSCTIERNEASINGGGIYSVNSNIEIIDTIISYNTEAKLGGGLYLENSSNSKIHNTFICNNTSNQGGGIYLIKSAPEIINTIVTHNTALEIGGGIYFISSNPSIIHSVISKNLSPTPSVYLEESSPTFLNSIIYYDEVYILSNESRPNFSYCDIEGGKEKFQGQGAGENYLGIYQKNIDADPNFKLIFEKKGTEGDGLLSDWSLKPTSLCINAGVNDSLYNSDIIGTERPYNKVKADIGAYEFKNNPPLAAKSADDVTTKADSTDEDTFIVIQAKKGSDVDNDNLQIIVFSLPEMKGELFQYNAGKPGKSILSEGSKLEDLEGRLIYQPVNRNADYVDSFSCKVNDGYFDSRNKEIIEINVTADNDPPFIKTSPSSSGTVGTEYFYDIEADDPDIEDKDLIFTLEKSPDWLTLTSTSGKTCSLKGNPPEGSEKNHEIIIGFSDAGGNYDEQKFVLAVKSQNKLFVDGGNDIIKEPGTLIRLEASGSEGKLVKFAWVIMNESGQEIKKSDGKAISFTPTEEGVYTAIVTASDSLGSKPAKDEVTISVFKGFSNIEYEDREPPTQAQEKAINELVKVDPEFEDFNVDETISLIAGSAELNLTPEQKEKVIAGMSKIIESGAINDANGSPARLNLILGAIENIIVYDSPNSSDKLNEKQINSMFSSIGIIVNNTNLNKFQLFKIIDILNKIITQQGQDNLTYEQVSNLPTLIDSIVRKCAILKTNIDADAFENVKFTLSYIDIFSFEEPLKIEHKSLALTSLTIQPDLSKEIYDQTGLDKMVVCIVTNTATGEHGSVISVRLLNENGEDLKLTDLATPFEITIPVEDAKKKTPMFFNTEKSTWSQEGITDADPSDEKFVLFKVNHLTDFTLLKDPASIEKDEDGIGTVINEATKTEGGGCFINEIIDNMRFNNKKTNSSWR
ncbi:MAG: hypothetical protein HQK76_06580 [Desulfobacterales bacterium]|nr:hypothetical protein [Desulfobacterales bacterium]